MNIIEMRGIYRDYSMAGEILHVLQDVDLDVQQGEYLAILGPSGSGKSTLMNIIGCMDTASGGEYILGGENICKMTERGRTKVRGNKIGFVFQKYQLISRYNVQDNIILPLLARGMSRHDACCECKDTVELLGLANRLSHRPSELSGGQQQRVAIARALVGKPAVLLADEPTGALDSKTGKEVLSLFDEMNALGNTVIMITHDAKVAAHAKRIVRIEDGLLTA